MSYVESSLIPGEMLVQGARHHWIMPLKRTVLLIFWLLVAGVIFAISSWGGGEISSAMADGDASGPSPSLITNIIRGVAGLLAVLVVYGYASFLLWLRSTEYAVTNNRVIMKSGLIRRSTYDVQLHQLETVSVHQGLVGRMLGYGTVSLSATGGSGGRWYRIADPLHFKKHIELAAQKRLTGGGDSPPPAADGPGRFRVQGVNKETREDAELVVQAGSAANAKVKGELEGLIVTGVEQLDDET